MPWRFIKRTKSNEKDHTNIKRKGKTYKNKRHRRKRRRKPRRDLRIKRENLPIEEKEPIEFINCIEKFIKQKLSCEIQYKIRGGHKFKNRNLIDLGAYVKCIKKGLIPYEYFEK